MLFLGPVCAKKGVAICHRSHPKWKKFVLVEITKVDYQLSKTLYFIKKSYILAELWIFFYSVWCFLPKKGHFQLKELWRKPKHKKWPNLIFAYVFRLIFNKKTYLDSCLKNSGSTVSLLTSSNTNTYSVLYNIILHHMI